MYRTAADGVPSTGVSAGLAERTGVSFITDPGDMEYVGHEGAKLVQADGIEVGSEFGLTL